MKKVVIILFLFFFVGCKTKPLNNFENDIFCFNRDSIIKVKNIEKIEHYKVNIDSGKTNWVRLEYSEVFNKNGNIIYLMRPTYLSIENKNYLLQKEGWTLEDKAKNMAPLETNIPTGRIDTTFYFYNKANKLIKEKENNGETTYQYDEHGNEVSRCATSDNSETFCNYTIYEYQNGRIIFKRDSLGASSIFNRHNDKQSISSIPKNKFIYDKVGRIISNGIVSRKFNSVGKVVEVDKQINGKFVLDYDNRGNNTQMTIYKIGFSFTDNKTNKTTNPYRPPKYVNYIYDSIDLIIEEKTLDNNYKLIELNKIKYSFFND
jgi:YD repeat-containing protein